MDTPFKGAKTTLDVSTVYFSLIDKIPVEDMAEFESYNKEAMDAAIDRAFELAEQGWMC